MSERRTVPVEVHNWDESFAVPAKDFLAQLTGLLQLVPEPFRDVAVLEFDRYGNDYDSSCGELTFHYTRPETDEEVREREQSAARRKTDSEARERAELVRLRAKYGR